jgi:hypothetical protein
MLYPEAMGPAFDTLPEPLRAFHSVEGKALYEGRVVVSHGSGLARTVAKAGGMPGTSGEMPFAFRMIQEEDGETWERNFGGHITRSRQWLHGPGVVAERVGTSTFLMEPRAADGALHIPITRITGFGLPVPRGLVASCEGVERVTEDGAITFDVHARLAGIGLIVRYRGQMRRADAG